MVDSLDVLTPLLADIGKEIGNEQRQVLTMTEGRGASNSINGQTNERSHFLSYSQLVLAQWFLGDLNYALGYATPASVQWVSVLRKQLVGDLTLLKPEKKMTQQENSDSRIYAFQGMGIRAIAAPTYLEWLDEFLSPWFKFNGDTEINKQVTLVEDNTAHRTLIGSPLVAQGLVGFILDGPPALLESRLTANGDLWFYDKDLDIFYHISGNNIKILSRINSHEGRFSMARLIRELFMELTFTTGDPVLHAAAIALNGRAALILGDKGAGKTTLSINCVTRLGFSFIANDRAAVLRGTKDTAWVQGIPTLVRVRNSSLPLLPELPWSRLRYPWFSRETLSKALELGAKHLAATDPYKAKSARFLSPTQHCWLMNTKPLAGIRLGVLLFPQVDNTVSGVLLEKLDPQEILTNLRTGAFNYNAEKESSRLFADTPVTTVSIDQRLAEIAMKIPAYRCRLGSRAFEDVDTLVQLMNDL